jgi:hypothetical protein
MNRHIAAMLVMACVMSAASLHAADARETTWHGVITDDVCAKKHMNAGDKACALKCVEDGAKFVLYDPKADRVFALSDQARAKEFAAEHVVIRGTLSADGKSITVAEIRKGDGKKQGKSGL